jgi:predicted CXXCH cytochrome family protein
MARHKHKPNPIARVPRFVWFGFGMVILLTVGTLLTAAHMEENDGFCASCHSQPESTYFQRTQAAKPVDLASSHFDHAVKCIDCHSGPGVVGRLGAMRVGTGDLVAFVTHTDKQPAPLTVPIGDANCLKCHADVPNTRDFNRHFHAFLSRWQAIDKNAATCVDCHSAHTTDGSTSLGFLQQVRTEQVCQRCHAVAGRG